MTATNETLERTTLPWGAAHELRSLIVTEGMSMSNGGTIYGVFDSEEDASSEHADELALGTVGASELTPAQREIAARNSERLPEIAAAIHGYQC